MSDIRPVKKDPYGKIKVSESLLEKDKEKFKEDKSKHKLNLFLAFFVDVIQKMIKFLKNKKPIASADSLLIDTIANLKNFFKKIQNEDVSANLEFYKEFSREWKKILKIYHLTKIGPPKKELTKTMIDELQKFPENKDFSLSYYLKSYQNENYIPQPVTEIIQKLHLNHQNNQKNSILKKWISLLNKILTS